MSNIEEIIKMFKDLCQRVEDLEKTQEEQTLLLKDIRELADETVRSEIKNFIFSPKEAAKILNISTDWLNTLFDEGEIGSSPTSPQGKKKVYTRYDLEEYAKKKRIPPLKFTKAK